MPQDSALDAQSFTYASPDYSAVQRMMIANIEKITGRLKIWRLYCEYRNEYGQTQESFWDAAIRKLDVSLDYDPAKLAAIPRTGPLVIVANHPFGVLDGIIITHLMERVRDDFKVLTNSTLCRAPEAAPRLLPIDFTGTEDAMRINLDTRREARDILKNNGCITVFPAGGVSTVTGWGDKIAQDTQWQPFIARLIQQSGATVVPVFFDGQNSRLFQIASLLSPVLRQSLFFKEVVNKMGADIGVRIGDAVSFDTLQEIKDRAALCNYLRSMTYDLGGMTDLPPPQPAYRLGS